MITVRSLSRSFGPLRAVDDLSFHLEPGEIFGLLGPNGAGKSTTIKMLVGILRPDSGSILLHDKEISPAEDLAFKTRIGYVPENCALYDNLTATEYLTFVGHLHHLDPDLIEGRSARLLDLVQLSASANQQIRDYSKGMKQKVLLVSALLHDPELIILDEPFSGLDANAVLLFKEILRAETQRGRTVIFCSHVLDVVERLVDRLLIINHGQAQAQGTPAEILAQTGHPSLDLAFNALTGTSDIAEQARAILDTVNRPRPGSERPA